MKVLYLTEHLSHADFLEHELRKLAPNIRLDVSPRIEDALARASTPGRYNAVLIDPIIRGTDGASTIARLRGQDPQLAVVAMTGPADEDPPFKLLDAGADDYVVKGPHFVKNLLLVLERHRDRRRAEGETTLRPIEVLHTGEIESARRYFRRPSLVKFLAMSIGADGCCDLPAAPRGRFPFDAVVLDDAAPGINLLRALKGIVVRAPDLPVVLLLAPGQDEIGSHGLKLGAAEYVLKGGDSHHSLARALESVIRRRDLLREKTALRAADARLRLIIETVPASIALLSRDGTFQAVNMAGLSLLGAAAIDQLVGKNLISMAGPAQQDRLRAFFEQVGAGARGAVEFDWAGADSVPRRLEMRAVLLRRETEPAPGILAALHEHEAGASGAPAAQSPGVEPAAGEIEKSPAILQARWEEERKTLEAERTAALDLLQAVQAKLVRAESERLAEQAAWLAERHEMEVRASTLEAALRAAEAEKARLEEDHRREGAAAENARNEMARQLQESQKQNLPSPESPREPEICDSGSEPPSAGVPGDPTQPPTCPEPEPALAEDGPVEVRTLHASVEELLRSLEKSQDEAEARIGAAAEDLDAAGAGLAPALALEPDHGPEIRQGQAEEKVRFAAEQGIGPRPAPAASEDGFAVPEERATGADAQASVVEDRRRSDSAEWENLRGELEKQHEARAALEARLMEILNEQQAAQAEFQAMGAELEQQRTARMTMEEALCASKARLTRLTEEHERLREESDALRQELQRQRYARLALEGALRAAESRQGSENFREIAASTMQALSTLANRMNECGELLMQCLDADDPRRLRAVQLIETAGQARSLADRLQPPDPRVETADLNPAR